MGKKEVNIGLIGFGTVGTGVVRLVHAYQEDLYKQTGVSIHIERILIKDPLKERPLSVQHGLLTTDPSTLLNDPNIDIVIEVMGGIEPAKTYIQKALEKGKHVVTANKDLMALYGDELLQLAARCGCDLYYEASVAGGIPILKTITDGFSSDRITKMIGIVNGTTNYILTKMMREAVSFEEALKEAQRLGYAEQDPTSDVDGLDAARKMAILASLGFHTGINVDDVSCKGIGGITVEDLNFAKQLGYTMKLVGIAKRDEWGIEVSVEPTLVKDTHPLAAVNDVFNAVYVYGEAVGETMFYGPGAGELPTATAVLSDLVSVVKNIQLGVTGKHMPLSYSEKVLKGKETIYAKFFLRLIVQDECGVLAKIAEWMAEEEISLEKVFQKPYIGDQSQAELILVTHFASKKSIEHVLDLLKQSDFIKEVKSCYRVEG
ncbi:homoserine dehydrogenase [Fervidibacillus halotolerans]|uniref:Homoserine dehydrogenase n=1 Tax=Fervidibacillus halotolerans TaxID=2980027 RepID=A0A9E8RYB5_9BACI|nr:homoserine dehydrogenase [Fervidibacillus halotolerans]WAA12063.1 homoserine dehydrogenase [Fervidibacillus halotolerans]